ncbi:NAD(P)/FAD-dependent oxidoreductase [Sediminibacter sp. Hel_I_10]|uniref:dihydrolipoyl dehydrogenase family protein n=1 Tax=Sediminibacter sp. Hel_I_10 TaxID=1392490 RepID=UPI00047E70EA|nr:NAD(P)/FAD-dependent oxidoreductase [Sediminibacter sp. Hel_I_10]
MKPKHYDVFIIGSGIAGQTAAKACAQSGMSVAIADKREYGGTCAIRGCDPKKVMLQFADLMQHAKQLKNLGVAETPKIDWKAVQQFKSQFTDAVPISTEKNLSELGIDLYHQSPKFISSSEIEVEGKTISAEKFVIATGYVPRTLRFEGAEFLQNSDDILNLAELPESATFIGAGYVGMEFGYMLASLGCKVTIIERGDRSLSAFDAYLVHMAEKSLAAIGVDFIFNAETISVELLNKNHRVTYRQSGKEHTLKTRVVYNTSGRVPAIDLLDLDKANIKADETGIHVNDFMQSESNPNVYACGDVSNKSLPLTPLSGLQGFIAGHNLIHGNEKSFEHPLVPSIVFTHPNLASVGCSEAEATSRYKSIKIFKGDASSWYNAKKNHTDTYAYKILVNERTDQIVGAHLLSDGANESINSLALAMQNEMTVAAFKKMIFTYPSYTNDLKSMLKNLD